MGKNKKIIAIIIAVVFIVLGSVLVAAGTDYLRYVQIMDNAFGPWDTGMTPCLILGIISLFVGVGIFVIGYKSSKNNNKE